MQNLGYRLLKLPLRNHRLQIPLSLLGKLRVKLRERAEFLAKFVQQQVGKLSVTVHVIYCPLPEFGFVAGPLVQLEVALYFVLSICDCA